GGPEFADALLWERWAGRLGQRADHRRALYFYLPVVLLGALPGTLLLFRRSARSDPGRAVPPDWIRRLASALGFLLVTFTLIPGKQAHYLVPLAPALALLLAWRIEHDSRALRLLRAGARVQLALLFGLAVTCALLIPRKGGSFGAEGRELVASGGAWLPLGLAGAAALAGLLASFRLRPSARAVLALSLASAGASLLPIHRLAGKLLYPHALAKALAAHPAAPIAFRGSSHHGIYALLAARDDLEKIEGEGGLEAWCRGAPGGLLLIDSEDLPAVLPAGLERVASDVVHKTAVEVWRITDAAGGPRVPP
ncbi:MAG: hypothetical protein HOP15_05465, partial [Planctomycetes bacterium]|nr:hypothetical protein [Planctomycetota bacterium]